MLDTRQLETMWRSSELLYGEVGNLHDFSHIRRQIMHFSYFSAMEVLVSNHPPLPVDLSFYRFCQSGAAWLCVLIDHYGVLGLDMLLFNGWVVLSSSRHYT
jgi:hypothetical protein